MTPKDQTLATVTNETDDTSPVSQDDDITIYSGSRYYYLDVLADNGYGVDSDIRSDYIKIILDQRKTDKGGSIRYDARTNTVKYTRPRAATETLAEFTDHFKYHLQDNSRKYGNSVDVDIAIKLNP